MPPPVVASAAQRLYDRLGPYAVGDEQHDYALLKLCVALTAGLQLLDDIASDDGDIPAWGKVLNVELCPLWALPWLAQLVGVAWEGEPTERLRQLIRERPSYRRGTPAAMVSAVREHLTGGKNVRFRERDSSPYRTTIITRTSETPNASAVVAAIKSQKPAGLLIAHVVSDTPLVNEGARTIDALTGTIDGATVANWT